MTRVGRNAELRFSAVRSVIVILVGCLAWSSPAQSGESVATVPALVTDLQTSAPSSTGDPQGAAMPPKYTETLPAAVAPIVTGVAKNYAQSVLTGYTDSIAAVEAMKRDIDRLLDSPTSDTLVAARKSWVHAHEVYSLTEVFRFYDGPIDMPETGPETLINAWPVDEAYIDYVEGNPTAGVINMPEQYPTIDRSLLVSLNEKGSEKNISTGFHAIEFLLWGQDRSTVGPGDRPVADYQISAGKNAARRATYLRVVCDLLLEHLKQVEAAWEPGAENYAATFLSIAPNRQLRRMFAGIVMMTGNELSQERMVVPLTTGDQENEQACFSDTTLVTLRMNLEGVRRIYEGNWGKDNGPGLHAVVVALDPALDAKIRTDLQTSIDAMNAIPLPFDQSLLAEPGKAKIQSEIEALETLTDSILRATSSMGIILNLK